MSFRCPGADRFIQPKPESFKCPDCGAEVEIWTDELKRICPKCGAVVVREGKQSCLDWCRYGKECVGEEIYQRFMRNKFTTLRKKIINELEEYLGSDIKRISHAKNVLKFAEKILQREGGDWHIVIPASILHDISIKVAEAKYDFSVPTYREEEKGKGKEKEIEKGKENKEPLVPRNILLKLGFKKEDIDEICKIIIYHHTSRKLNTQNFKVLYDADLLANLKEKAKHICKNSSSLVKDVKKCLNRERNKDKQVELERSYSSIVEVAVKSRKAKQEILRLEEFVNNTFLTRAGKEIARKCLGIV